MSERHRRANNIASVTSHVGGGGSNSNNRNGNRRVVPTVPATAHVGGMPQGMVGAVPQWAHQHPGAAHPMAAAMNTTAAAYTNADFMYRFGNAAGGVITQAPTDVFAPAPYMPVGDVTMSRQLQRRFQPPPEPKEKTIVNSQQFIQFPVIYNLDSKPVVSCMPQLNGIQTQTFTTANKYNDAHVLLRRVVDCPTITAAHASAVFERLRHFRHPNLVKLNGITQTNEFILGSNDVVFEYRFVRNARSLKAALLSAPTRRDPSRSAETATEGQIWSFAVQLVGLVRSFHELKQPIRGLHYSKMIFVEDTNRIMFTGLGLVDLVQGFGKGTLEEQFAEDIRSIGEILLHLATGSSDRVTNYKDEALWERLSHCSDALKKLIEMCLSASSTAPVVVASPVVATTNNNNHSVHNTPPPSNNTNNTSSGGALLTIQDICTLLANRISIEVGHQQGHADYLLHECSKAQENGRMMKLMMRLNLILASEESHPADTNERVVLRLFHQYVFHQVDENGRARLDWGHIYHCLNKLDIGSDEIIQMVGGDHDAIIVASFEDIKNSLEQCFRELEEDSQRGPDTTMPASGSLAAVTTPLTMGMMMGGTPASMMGATPVSAVMGGTPSTLGQPGMRYGMFP